jgi:riboflavin kinase/FMN adenylyltransferase
MGEVVRGDGRGESLGFRTANLVLPEQLILPKDGVYTASAIVEGETERQALVSVGVRPTFGPSPRLFEVHILDFDRQIYGCQVRVFLQRRLRGQKRFDSRAGLIEAMRADVDAARALGPIDVSDRMPF